MRSHPHLRPRPAPRSAFAGYRFPPEVISLAVRWYPRFGLSYRDVEELLAERGIEVDHVTVYRWVQRFAPEFAEAARASVTIHWAVNASKSRIAPARSIVAGMEEDVVEQAEMADSLSMAFLVRVEELKPVERVVVPAP